MSDDKIMCIVNAPRIEIVLVPQNQAQHEGDEVEDDTLLDAYLMLHLHDGMNVNLKLDGGPFDLAGERTFLLLSLPLWGRNTPLPKPGAPSRRPLSMPGCGSTKALQTELQGSAASSGALNEN
jgi:hypothetical protein